MWDGASYHKYGELRDFLSSVNSDKEPSDWPLTCILFAPNSPQQNPVEDIWLQAKNVRIQVKNSSFRAEKYGSVVR